MPEINTINVCDIQRDTALAFVNNDREVQSINEMYGTEYDSFFIEIGDGDYKRVFGMYGIVPYFSNILYQVK